jgi:hypothetical protein
MAGFQYLGWNIGKKNRSPESTVELAKQGGHPSLLEATIPACLESVLAKKNTLGASHRPSNRSWKYPLETP